MKKIIFTVIIGFIGLTGFGQKGDAETFFKKAEELSMDGNYKEAIENYTKAIAADPEYTNAYLRRAFCYSANKEYENAITDYSKIIAEHPEQTNAYISRGSAYNKLEKYKKAIEDFDKALSIDSKGIQAQEAFNNRGWSKKGLGDVEGACSDWKQSKKLGNAEAKLILKNNHCK